MLYSTKPSLNVHPRPSSTTRTYAVPSWVMAGSIFDNAHFILAKNREAQAYTIDTINAQDRDAQDTVHGAAAHPLHITEIGLCFFEMSSCLAYTEDDLSMSLADLPFTWHVHLPSDLPWSEGGASVARIALELMDKVAFLGVRRAVLHPPIMPSPDAHSPAYSHDEAAVLRDFVSVWVGSGRCAEDIHIENIDGHDLLSLWSTIEELGCRVCLDTGHLLAYRQDALRDFLLGSEVVEEAVSANLTGLTGSASYNTSALARIGMMHLCGTSASGRHGPLTGFSSAERAVIAALCGAVPYDAVMMLELFKWEHVEASWPLVCDWV